jgi:hAT family C-terminal dimerisation region
MMRLAFLTDITDHLNQLNTKLQGEDKLLPKMYESIESFQGKLTMFTAHLLTKNLRHFPILAKMVSDVDRSFLSFSQQDFVTMIGDLSEEFHRRFQECKSKAAMFQFTLNPFSVKPESLGEFIPSDSISEAELELIELQNDVYLSTSTEVNRQECVSMWKAISAFPDYQKITQLAKKVISMFGSTYKCESTFSIMKHVKSKNRSRLSDEHLMDCLRAATTTYVPHFETLAQEIQSQGSH